jgi:aminoglycoside phosphotransferase (APT) family kinase protein
MNGNNNGATLSLDSLVYRNAGTTMRLLSDRQLSWNSVALWGTDGQAAGMSAPAAEGNRVEWGSLPRSLTASIEQIIGSQVVKARTQPGGFSPGVASRLHCADGTRWFVKAVSAEANPDTPGIHRREARNLRALDPFAVADNLPIARLRGVVEQDPWIALILDDVEGRNPGMPWRPDELARVLAAVDMLSDALTPAPIAVPDVGDKDADEFKGWRELAEAGGDDRLDRWSRDHLGMLAELEQTWGAHAAGDTLLHTDLRADNMLLTGDRVVIVDWPYTCRGAAFVDVVLLAPSVAMQGGPEPAELAAVTRAGRSADRHAMTAMVCALAGYFTERSLRPPPPGIPTVRAFQAAQGEIARRWLADLL